MRYGVQRYFLKVLPGLSIVLLGNHVCWIHICDIRITIFFCRFLQRSPLTVRVVNIVS